MFVAGAFSRSYTKAEPAAEVLVIFCLVVFLDSFLAFVLELSFLDVLLLLSLLEAFYLELLLLAELSEETETFWLLSAICVLLLRSRSPQAKI